MKKIKRNKKEKNQVIKREFDVYKCIMRRTNQDKHPTRFTYSRRKETHRKRIILKR